MQKISELSAGRAGEVLGRPSRLARVPGVILLFALLHNPVQGLGAIVSGQNGVVVNWNRSSSTAVTGYRVYYGTASRNYTSSVVAGNVTNATISGLAKDTTYYFAATTYDAAKAESHFSDEAIYNPVVSTTNAAPVGIINLPPTLNLLANLNLGVNAGLQTVNLAGITSGAANEKQTLKVSASSSNRSLILSLRISYTSPNSAGRLTFRPMATVTGTAVITVTVNDGGKSNNTVTQKFTVTVGKPVSAVKPASSNPLTTSLPSQTKISQATPASATSAAFNGLESAFSSKTSFVPGLPAVQLRAASNQQFILTVSGLIGHTYEIQATSDFSAWTVIGAVTLDAAASLDFTDTNAASFSQRFYRTRETP